MSSPTETQQQESGLARLDEALVHITRSSLIGLGLGIAVLAIVIAVLSRSVRFLHMVNLALNWGLLIVFVVTGLVTWRRVMPSAQGQMRSITVLAGLLAVFSWLVTPDSAAAHPVFNTPLTGEPGSRPSIRVDIHKDWEWMGTMELYLSVQSSRFPNNVGILLPLNVGDFEGRRSRFVALPFEVQRGDNLIFNLLDDDGLGDAEPLVLKAASTVGYCIRAGAFFYQPELGLLLDPAFMPVGDVLGQAIVKHTANEPFQHMGVGGYIVPASPPDQPHLANKMELLDANRLSRATVRVYFPTTYDEGFAAAG